MAFRKNFHDLNRNMDSYIGTFWGRNEYADDYKMLKIIKIIYSGKYRVSVGVCNLHRLINEPGKNGEQPKVDLLFIDENDTTPCKKKYEFFKFVNTPEVVLVNGKEMLQQIKDPHKPINVFQKGYKISAKVY